MNFKPTFRKVLISIILGFVIAFVLLSQYFGGNFISQLKDHSLYWIVIQRFITGAIFYIGLVYLILSLINKKK